MMPKAAGMFSGTMVVGPSSWHGRFYQYWKKHARFKTGPDYRENLCHYTRVVLIWAPVMWLRRSFSQVLGPFKPIGRGFGRVGKGLGDHFGDVADWLADYFIVSVALILFATAFVFLVVMAILHPLAMLLLALQATVNVAVIAVALSVLCWTGRQVARRNIGSRPLLDTVQLIGHVVVAKKRGICPFIEFSEEASPETVLPIDASPAVAPVVVSEPRVEERVLEPV